MKYVGFVRGGKIGSLSQLNQRVRDFVSLIVYRMIGAPSFARRVEWRTMLSWLHPQRGEKILDVACGDGLLALKIAARGPDVYGIDMSAPAIDSARRLAAKTRTAVQCVVADAQHLPYPDAHFDRVVCSSSLEHMADDLEALKEMRRVLKVGGNLVLTVDSLTYPMSQELKEMHRTACFVVHYYSREELAEKLALSGLVLDRSKYLLNSWLTHAFFDLWVKYRRHGALWLVVALVGYPAFLISDCVFGKRGSGYTVVAQARRV